MLRSESGSNIMPARYLCLIWFAPWVSCYIQHTKVYTLEQASIQSQDKSTDCAILPCPCLRYQNYAALKSIVNTYIPNKKAKILMIGCGTSNMSEEMFLDGYTDIVNIDVSPVYIEYMTKKHANYRGLSCMYFLHLLSWFCHVDEHFD